MKTVSGEIRLRTKPDFDMLDITGQVSMFVAESGIKSGTVTVFVVGSTAAVSTVEFEPGMMKDIPASLEKIAPSGADYEHHKTWGCDNGKSHVRATLIGPGITVPVIGGKLPLGAWQQIVLMELDTKPRDRTVVLQVIGE